MIVMDQATSINLPNLLSGNFIISINFSNTKKHKFKKFSNTLIIIVATRTLKFVISLSRISFIISLLVIGGLSCASNNVRRFLRVCRSFAKSPHLQRRRSKSSSLYLIILRRLYLCIYSHL